MLALVAIIAVAVTGVAGDSTAAASKQASLTITYWQDETVPAEFTRRTLRCGPAGGTLANRRRACAKLSVLAASSFAPVPADAICTQIYGGPQKAVVKGTIGGQRVWASFRRRNGCEIARWQRFSPWLLPAGGGTR
jgi:hypothetical protein